VTSLVAQNVKTETLNSLTDREGIEGILNTIPSIQQIRPPMQIFIRTFVLMIAVLCMPLGLLLMSHSGDYKIRGNATGLSKTILATGMVLCFGGTFIVSWSIR
jgi:hypothetical protein